MHVTRAILRHMKVEEIAEAIAKLPPDQLARFRRGFTAFEQGRTDHAKELDSTATKLGRLTCRNVPFLGRLAVGTDLPAGPGCRADRPQPWMGES